MLRLRAGLGSRGRLHQGTFEPVLGDPVGRPADVRPVVLCSGKIYYDLAARRQRAVSDDRLHPGRAALPDARGLSSTPVTLPRFDIAWVQEEPANQGAWPHMALTLPDALAAGAGSAGLAAGHFAPARPLVHVGA